MIVDTEDKEENIEGDDDDFKEFEVNEDEEEEVEAESSQEEEEETKSQTDKPAVTVANTWNGTSVRNYPCFTSLIKL